MALTLSNSIFLSGTAFNATVEGAAADSTLALTTNPGGRWSLGGRLLVCSNPQAGDMPAVTETLAGGGSTAYPFTISVRNAPSSLRVSGSPVAASVGTSLEFAPTITGGVPPYSVQVIGRLPAGRSLSGTTIVGTYLSTGPNVYALQVGDATGAAARLTVSENVRQGATVQGTPLRGYSLTAVGAIGSGGNWQSRTAPAGAFVDEGLSNPFTIGNGSGGAGAVGREYRYRAVFEDTEVFSAGVGPTGVTDSILPASNAFATTGQDIANINTGRAGGPVGTPGVTWFNSLSYYADEMGENVDFKYRWDGTNGTGGSVLAYAAIVRNNYFGGVPAVTPAAPIQISNLGPMTATWNLAREGGSVDDANHLIEFYPINSPTFSMGAITNEVGIMPWTSAAARAYFSSGPGRIPIGAYVDENGLSWPFVSMPPGASNPGRYILGYEPTGTPRLSGSFSLPRWLNWLQAQGVISGNDYMPGIASGLEMIANGAMAGRVTGKLLPSPANMPWTPAAAYTFDTDVAAYFARFTSLPGIEVRKALDAFVVALKANSLYALLDDFNPMWLAGKVDMRRAFKSASHDIVDRAGTASYVPGKGMTYAGAGYGGTGFNPATAGGQFAQDSAFMFGFIEADAGAVTAKFMGNATANMGRNAGGTSISHQLNNAPSVIAGTYPLQEGLSVRRVAGVAPGGTGGAAGYQVKRSGSTNAITDQTGASTALTSWELEIGRAGSGTVYSSAVFSMIAYGGGMTAAQVDNFNSLVVAMRTAAKAAGI